MHRIDDLHIFATREPRQRLANALEAVAETLAPVCGDQNQFLRGIEGR